MHRAHTGTHCTLQAHQHHLRYAHTIARFPGAPGAAVPAIVAAAIAINVASLACAGDHGTLSGSGSAKERENATIRRRIKANEINQPVNPDGVACRDDSDDDDDDGREGPRWER